MFALDINIWCMKKQGIVDCKGIQISYENKL